MKIILNLPHTHAGIEHAIGAELDVLMHDAEYLVACGVANFKAGVQKLEKKLGYAADAAEPVAAADPAATETPSLTVDTGATHE
jgi:hypothetical protein